jgi:hypothetical protein
MRVTFTCEKCGWVPVGAWKCPSGQTVAAPDCPNCAKVTYGPLTEEMVAEALATARIGGCLAEKQHLHEMVWRALMPEARFVLRLLNEFGKGGEYVYNNRHDGVRWLDWLLDLARKP